MGIPIANALGWHPIDDRMRLNKLIAQWLETDMLEERDGKDEHRKPCKVLVATEEYDFGYCGISDLHNPARYTATPQR